MNYKKSIMKKNQRTTSVSRLYIKFTDGIIQFPKKMLPIKFASISKIKLSIKDCDRSLQSTRKLEETKKLSRTKRIKQKNIIYPLSTPNKITFITNLYGVGFKRQKLEQLQCPSHIPIQKMLSQVNEVCYEQWKNTHERLSTPPFQKVQFGLGVIFSLIFLITIVYFCLLNSQKIMGFQSLNFIIVALVFLIFVITIYLCLSKRQNDDNTDIELIHAIQKKLLQFNVQELKDYKQPRFRWTCHRDCLWISLNL